MQVGNWACAMGLALGGLVCAGAARAEEPHPQPKPTEATTPAPDIVRMKNGGFVRGTITELVPNESVTLLTTTGETRSYAMADVAYAGAASAEPPPPRPAASAPPVTPPAQAAPRPGIEPYLVVEGKAARVHLASDPPGFVFMRQDAAATVGRRGEVQGFARICAAPCDIRTRAGRETIRATREGAWVEKEVDIPAGDSELRVRFEDNQAYRTAGWLLMGGGLATGLALLVKGSHERDESTGKALVGAGWLVGLGGLGVGIGLVLVSDKTDLKQLPDRSPHKVPEKEEDALVRGTGLTLHGTF